MTFMNGFLSLVQTLIGCESESDFRDRGTSCRLCELFRKNTLLCHVAH